MAKGKLSISQSEFSCDKQGVPSCAGKARVTSQIASQLKQPLSPLAGAETGSSEHQWPREMPARGGRTALRGP